MDPNSTPNQQPAAAPQPNQPAPAPEMPAAPAPAAPDVPKPASTAADKKSSAMWLTLGVVVVAIIVVAYFLFLK